MELWFSDYQTDKVKVSIKIEKQLFGEQTDFQRIDAVADQLLLHALARIHEIILFVDVDRLGRRMPVRGGFGRGGA